MAGLELENSSAITLKLRRKESAASSALLKKLAIFLGKTGVL